jgi:peptide/nickel transport system permease protein
MSRGRGRVRRGTMSSVAILVAFYAACVAFAPPGALATLPMAEAFVPPGWSHPLGTDDLGRDLLGALLQGGRTSLFVAGLSTVLALALGTLAGVAAGTAGDWLDEALMRTADVVAGLPSLLVAVLVVALFGGSTLAVTLVLGLTRWPMVARLVRVEALVIARSDFVRAAAALGVGRLAIVCRHILPHVATQTASAAGILFGGAIVAEAALAFVGLGDPSVTSWGLLLSSGFAFHDHGWWLWAAPAAVLAFTAGLVAVATDRTD